MISTTPPSEHFFLPSTDDPPSRLDELESLRENFEHLSLALTAIGHEMRQGFHVLLASLNRCSATGVSRRERRHVQSARDLVDHLAVDFENLATLAVLSSVHSETGLLEAVAVRPLLESTQMRWQSEARQKGIRLRLVSPDVSVLSNARWLEVILSNIVGNAVRHSNAGEVTIEGQSRLSDLILAVRDCGHGINEAEMRRAFGAIQPPKSNRQGLGLGLSIARRAAALLGHELGISSTPFKGTAVRLRMPITRGSLDREPLLPDRYFDAT